jgi:hypothetical protein
VTPQAGGDDEVNGRESPPATGPAEGARAAPDDIPDELVPAPLHPALVPRGEAVAWSALGSLLAGPVVWGGVGALADHVLGTGRIFLVIGLLVGTMTGTWIVYVRFGQDEAGHPRS